MKEKIFISIRKNLNGEEMGQGLVASLKSLEKWVPIPYGTPCNKPSLWPHHPAEETYLIPAKLPPKGKRREWSRGGNRVRARVWKPWELGVPCEPQPTEE